MDGMAYALLKETRDAVWDTLRQRELIAVYLNGDDAECEMQRLDDVRRSSKGSLRYISYRIEEVPFHE